MFKTKIMSSDELSSVSEEYFSCISTNNTPNLCHHFQDEVTNLTQWWRQDQMKNKSQFATVRTFYPTGRQKKSDMFSSFFEEENDLSTRHVENFDKDMAGRFRSATWNWIPSSQNL